MNDDFLLFLLLTVGAFAVLGMLERKRNGGPSVEYRLLEQRVIALEHLALGMPAAHRA